MLMIFVFVEFAIVKYGVDYIQKQRFQYARVSAKLW